VGVVLPGTDRLRPGTGGPGGPRRPAKRPPRLRRAVHAHHNKLLSVTFAGHRPSAFLLLARRGRRPGSRAAAAPQQLSNPAGPDPVQGQSSPRSPTALRMII